MVVLSRKEGESVITDYGLFRVVDVTPERVELVVLTADRHSFAVSGDSSVAPGREFDGLRRYRIRLAKNESLSIDDDKTIIYIAIGPRGQARLGFELPKALRLHRLEVYEAVLPMSSESENRVPVGPIVAEIDRVYANRRLLDEQAV